LPEAPGGERNWDYRFSWIRDSAFALWGLHSLGFEWEANDYFWFLADQAERDGDNVQIVYGLDGERDLEERQLDHLSGYEGARPVRLGNAAYRQRQLDVFGAALDSIYIHTRSVERLDDRIWPVLRGQVESALRWWRKPDRGIWEVRGEPRHFTSSKVMCWVAADRAASLARMRGERELEATWRAAADEIHADVCANGLDGRGVFTQHYGGEALDASLLLIPMVGFLPPEDTRVRATVRAIAEELTEDGLVLRYRTKESDDGLAGEEGSFTTCSFWLVSALSLVGERAKARELCEKLLSFASPLGLYAEEIDSKSGRHLGNFPQAFTHLALINAVLHVIGDEEDGAEDVDPDPA
jgi:GH15 family glucan-1,4-alpha-glucosidase